MMLSNVKALPVRNAVRAEQRSTVHRVSAVNIFAAVICVVGVYIASIWMMQNLNQPIAVVKVEGDFQRLSEQEIESALAPYVSAQFLMIDLDTIQHVVRALPWVSNVTVRRIWPDGLSIKVKEEMAIARWGEKQLLDEEGRVFSPEKLQDDVLGLPRLNGPEGYEKKVMEQYERISQLLRPLNRRITHLTLAARGAWDLQLDDGMKVMLGRDHLMEKTQRFIQLYQTELAQSTTPILAIDVRYNNGIAVQWGVPPAATPTEILTDVKS
jgi:cell division protein FtsQ